MMSVSFSKGILACCFAPAMAAGFGWGAWSVVQGGRSHAYLFILLAVAALVCHAVEQLLPYEASWNQSDGDLPRDLLHALVNEVAAIGVVYAVPWIVAHESWPSVWPTKWPLGAQWLFAIIVTDAGITLTHYASHHSGVLWRLHAVHHSVERFHGLNGLVKHPLHQAVETFVGTFPLVVMGVTEQVAALLAFSVGLQLMLQHCNVDLRLGLLRHVWAIAPVHRFHHRKWAGVGDVNFGLFTPWWDYLLGTAVFDSDARFGPGDFGIGTQPDYPKAYLAQLMQPFRR